MYAHQRREATLLRARLDGRVDVAGLAARFAVTTETVRRDLTRLERDGLVRRVHGGALPVAEPSAAGDPRAAQAERIGKTAVAYLPREGSVLIDAGTTTARLVDALPVEAELTVVTNALPVAQRLVNRPGWTVLVLGGRMRGSLPAQVGTWAERMLGDLHVDVAFLSAQGVSVDHGLTTPDPAEAETKRAMIAAAGRVVLLADSSKVGQVHLVRFGEVDQVDVFITDDGLDDRVAEQFQSAGAHLVRA